MEFIVETNDPELIFDLFNGVHGISASDILSMIRTVYGENFYEYVYSEMQPYLTFSARISLSEHYIYGSSRLGTRMVDKELYRNLLSYQGLSAPLLEQAGLNLSQPAYNMACGCVEDPEQDSDEDEDSEQPGPGLPAYAHVYRHRLGYKQYELTNHLGNVLATVLDRRTGQLLQPSDTAYAWYQADVPSAQDYYPFGMQMPGRVYVADTISGYRYGFNGMEKDEEVKGSGNSYDFGARMYDSRLGRWFSLDPKMNIFPSWSAYNFSFANPILFKDKDGEVPIVVIDEQSKTIMIYQPVFVVTKGPGSVSPTEIANLQAEFDDKIKTGHLQAISTKTGQKYDIVIQFQFYDGGTYSEAQQMNKEAQKMLGMQVHGTFSSFVSDADFENKYKQFGGSKNPYTLGGFTVSKMDIFMRGSKATWRERVHEGFHLLFLKDDLSAVGIMAYSDGYGKGPGVNASNVEDAINLSLLNFGSVLRFDASGIQTSGDYSGESFSVKSKPASEHSGPGSGMGRTHFSELEGIE